MTISNPTERSLATALLFVVCLGLVACAATRQGSDAAEPAGFLGDYSDLKPGGKGEPGLLYVRSGVDWMRYDSIIIDSVQFWNSSGTQQLTDEERRTLGSHFFGQLEKQLSKTFKLVHQPGPTTLRLRVALTEAKGANVPADVITGVIPQLRAITMLGGLAADKAEFVGEAAVEVEMLDSTSNQRLGAMVDERWGTKSPTTVFKEWGDVEKATDYWAEHLEKRLVNLRAGNGASSS